ncbi:hypothetical protein FACS189434_08210 [Bacteroidia bacterium]|nr:hypothetical protein FACS189434_08210 [Bacteroidia bacterium]
MANYNDYLKHLHHVDNTTKQEIKAKEDALNNKFSKIIKSKNAEIAQLKESLTNLNDEKTNLTAQLELANAQEQNYTINQQKILIKKQSDKLDKIQKSSKHTIKRSYLIVAIIVIAILLVSTVYCFVQYNNLRVLVDNKMEMMLKNADTAFENAQYESAFKLYKEAAIGGRLVDYKITTSNDRTSYTIEEMASKKFREKAEELINVLGECDGTAKTLLNYGKELYNSAKINNLLNQCESLDKGVIINGVKWATRNVDEPGTFAATPESAGKFYQWNRKKAWAATGTVTAWDNSTPGGTTWEKANDPSWKKANDPSWEKANDPSPAGWRVPTYNEMKSLLNTAKVSNIWTTQNGVTGRRFTDKDTGNSLFLPAAGYRGISGGTLGSAGSYGGYWSSTQYDSGYAYGLYFDSGSADWFYNDRSYGFSVRVVAE